jgi:hypothetical protein
MYFVPSIISKEELNRGKINITELNNMLSKSVIIRHLKKQKQILSIQKTILFKYNLYKKKNLLYKY